MEYIYYDAIEQNHEDEIRDLLFGADKEFVPPLSERQDTTQTKWSDSMNSDAYAADAYFQKMKTQSIIIARDNQKTVGFLSYIPKHKLIVRNADPITTSYVSTIVVLPSNRGKGVCPQMYQTLFSITPDNSVSTRTWSTNLSHIHILEKLGFKNIATLPDDRGNGIDTVYFSKQL